MNNGLRPGTLLIAVLSFLAITVILAISGCGSSRLGRFPDFPSHKERLGGSMIITDFLIMRATNTDTPSVDVQHNKVVADTLMAYAQGVLDSKGYNVGGRMLSSVGLLLNDDFSATLADGPDGYRSTNAFSKISHPPFYLYQALRRDTTMKILMKGMYTSLLRFEETDGRYPPVEEVVPMGKIFGGGMVFVFVGGGYEVPAAIGEAEAKGPLSGELSKIGFHTISQASLYLYVLDAGTGEVLWIDHHLRKGGMMYQEKFIQMAGELLEELP